MIAETPRMLLGFLIATTVIGGIIGYCLSQLYVKRQARQVIRKLRQELVVEKKAADADLQMARESIDVLRSTLDAQQETVSNATQREEALETHSQLQAQRIQSLETQVASYEDQQIRLQRDFASYKSNKTRELEVARNTPESWSNAGKLPILSRRIDDEESEDEQAPTPLYVKNRGAERKQDSRRHDALSQPLSRELDIPTLAESELPDSVDDLDFELAELPPGSASQRG